MNILYTIITILVLTQISIGSDWVKVAESQDRNMIYYADNESIVNDKLIKKVWIKIVYKKESYITSDDNKKVKITESKGYYNFNCPKKTYKYGTIVYYYKNVYVLSDEHTDIKYFNVVPDTMIEGVYLYICK